MISEFGGDIFDDEPPAAVPPKKGGKERSSSVQKVNLKAQARRGADDLGFTPAPEGTADEGAAPADAEATPTKGRRGRRRRSTGREDAQQDAGSEVSATPPAATPRRGRGGRATAKPKEAPAAEAAADDEDEDKIEAFPLFAEREDEGDEASFAGEDDLLEQLGGQEDDEDEAIIAVEEVEEEEFEEEILEETLDEPLDESAAGDVPVPLEDDEDEELFEPAPSETRLPDEERGPGRRRRRRRGRDRERERERPRNFEPGGERTRDDRGPIAPPPPRAVPPGDRTPRPERGGAWAPATPGSGARTTPATQRVALFVDVEALQHEAQSLGGQISFSRLLRQITGSRTLARAIAYCAPSSRGTGGVAGLETVRVEREAHTPVAIAVDALATAPRVDCVVIAPEPLAVSPLVRALRAAGVRVESAGFEARGPSEVADHLRLGKEALFAP
ncbi:MAG: NYN domain-containing protein [Planctomycetota bacterium]